MSHDTIPFHRASPVGREQEYLEQALKSGLWCGGRHFGPKCEALLEERHPGSRAILTPSGTMALEMMALLLDLKEGDEVIVPSFTFSATASSVALRGATPVFADIEPGTLNLSLASARASISERTKAIMVVHYAGFACEMDGLEQLCEEHNLLLLEDAAQALGATWKGRALGSIGQLGAFSFHETKNVTCGEGGAVLVNRPELVERAELVRERGTDRARFMKREIPKYTWQRLGSSYLMNEFAAAVLLAQLEQLDTITERRRDLWKAYSAALASLQERGRAQLFAQPEGALGNGHIFWMLLDSAREREMLQEHLLKRNIVALPHFAPLHTSKAGRELGLCRAPITVAEALAERLLRLPMFLGLEPHQERVIEAVLGFFSA